MVKVTRMIKNKTAEQRAFHRLADAVERLFPAPADAGATRWTLPQRPDHGALSPLWLAVHDCLTRQVPAYDLGRKSKHSNRACLISAITSTGRAAAQQFWWVNDIGI